MNKFKPRDLNKAPNELAKEILHMVNEDQEARFSNFEPDKIKEIDIRNTKRVKEIINEQGYPTIDEIGEDASSGLWLLTQHADLDTEFQEKCLFLMKSLKDGQVSKKNIAYLEDRVRVAKGLPTLYGTQFHKREDGKLVLREIEDRENVNKRRKDMDLNTLEEYVSFLYSQCEKECVPEGYLD